MGHRHPILAKSFLSRWLPKPVLGLVLRRRRHHLPWPRCRHSRRRWPSLVRLRQWRVQLSAPPTRHNNLANPQLRLRRPPLRAEPDVVCTKVSIVHLRHLMSFGTRTMTIIHSSSVTLSNIYVNSTSHSHAPARNTDGADTIYADNITFRNWTVDNGDDSIAMKANSTNVLIEDCTFYRGLGVAIGSIGQYAGVFETIENVTARDVTCYGTRHAGYVKTWTGEQVGYPPNGGGGGLGCMYSMYLSLYHPLLFFPLPLPPYLVPLRYHSRLPLRALHVEDVNLDTVLSLPSRPQHLLQQLHLPLTLPLLFNRPLRNLPMHHLLRHSRKLRLLALPPQQS